MIELTEYWPHLFVLAMASICFAHFRFKERRRKPTFGELYHNCVMEELNRGDALRSSRENGSDEFLRRVKAWTEGFDK